jgi:glycosyltransferase involved in cell wall biosynthesis
VLWLAPVCALTLFLSIRGLLTMRAVSYLEDSKAPEPKPWPRVSVIVPACNEAETLEAALSTLLGQTYPELEIVLIDDRSTDGTGALIDRMASNDRRIRPIHVTELPSGWLGKVHALSVGAKAASGEWLLFTDADVHFAPRALEAAVSDAIARGLDHLTVLPWVPAGGFWHEVALGAFSAAFVVMTRLDQVGRPGTKAYAGVGAFNLVRRVALEKSEGFEWIRMEVADDVALAMALKLSGAKPGFEVSRDLISVVWYRDLGEMLRGLEKNVFGVFAYYSFLRLGPQAVAFLAWVIGPYVALSVSEPRWIAPLGACTVLSALLFNVLLGRVGQRRWYAMVLGPLGQLIMLWAVFRSARACWRQKGISWRGTYYSLAELRQNQRIKLM